MRRVNAARLIRMDEMLYYENLPFSGVAFFIEGCFIVNAIVYQEGDYSAAYHNAYFFDDDSQEKVLASCLQPDDIDYPEPLALFMNKPFTGLSYEFDGSFCFSEILYLEGVAASSVYYSKSGQPNMVELFKDGLYQKYLWFENGNLRTYELSSQPNFHFLLDLADSGKFTCLMMNGNYFENISNLVSNIKNNQFIERDAVITLTASEDVLFIGASINDDLIGSFFAKGNLFKTFRIRLFRVSITSAILNIFGMLPALRAFSVEKAPNISIDDMVKLKRNCPDCLVEFDRINVTVKDTVI
jgi:hypothetical protein